MSTVVCIGTGPSLTMDQVDIARQRGFRLFGCNNTAFDVPDLELLYGCNFAWWDEYWCRVKHHAAEKWTTNPLAAKTFGVNHINERYGRGLCTDPGMIHHGHGSGYSLVSMAHKKGATRVLLLGYDLKYAVDYDGRNKRIGSTPRHYFDEYPPRLQHWPSKRVVDGVHVELVDLYQSIDQQGLIEIINCSPDSALAGKIPCATIDAV